MMDVDRDSAYQDEQFEAAGTSHPQPGIMLQIPDEPTSATASSRSAGGRPVSAAVYPTSSVPPPPSGAAARRHRASHNVSSTTSPTSATPAYHDVYAHPAAVAYANAHPRRQIPKFGPYLLLQTLGEGEFGKVKLGLHGDWGEEVAVKLMRRGSVDATVRMSKVEREIEVLRSLNHPNIVRLYDVIETDKYIGIILEYASGGELFDHILAHRYLRERDACKLFAQLISGVWYIHQKKIVHRDLKLENLLLDRNRNVIITDFGFANRFEHKSDDLMQTSCGSPCYAAPELVISEGLYVGSAVDIWSCGVILYAMLAGYLPFDDDPTNPDGDNINLLYKYIINTPLTFPDYISAEARDLLGIMLVPDPTKRTDLRNIMAHRWLRPYALMFNHTVDQLEESAREQQLQKRQAYQRQMRARHQPPGPTRTQSARPELTTSSTSPRSSRREREPVPEFLYETSGDPSRYQPSPASPTRRAVASAIIPMSSPAEPTMPDTIPTSNETNYAAKTGSTRSKAGVKTPSQSPEKKKAAGHRHTIQVEYDAPESSTNNPMPLFSEPSIFVGPPNGNGMATSPASYRDHQMQVAPSTPTKSQGSPTTPTKHDITIDPSTFPIPVAPSTPRRNTPPGFNSTPRQRATSYTNASPIQPAPQAAQPIDSPLAPISNVDVAPNTAPSESPLPAMEPHEKKTNLSMSSASTSSSKKSRHRKGLSLDKLGFGKFLGNGHPSQSGTSSAPPTVKPLMTREDSDGVMVDKPPSRASNRKRSDTATPGPTPPTVEESGSVKAAKKSRRTTLSVIVDPFSRGKDRNRGASRSSQAIAPKPVEPPLPSAPALNTRFDGPAQNDAPFLRQDARPTPSAARLALGDVGPTASTGKAKKVMDWFRNKSLKQAADTPLAASLASEEPPQSPIVFSRGRDDGDDEPTTPKTSIPPSRTPTLIVTTPTAQTTEPRETARKASVTASNYSTSDNHASAPSSHTRAATDVTASRHASVNLKNFFTSPFLSSAPNSTAAPLHPGQFHPSILRLHHGAVDPTAVTTGYPPDVFAQVTRVLLDMGLQLQNESQFKYRCIRQKRRKPASYVGLGINSTQSTGSSLTALTMSGTAALNGVDKRGLPTPSSLSSSGGGMLKGLLRRGSSQVASPLTSPTGEAPSMVASPLGSPGGSPDVSAAVGEAVYGDRTVDQGDEVRFSVELTRIDRLDDTYSLDVRRLKGNLRSYKFLYDTLRERCVFS